MPGPPSVAGEERISATIIYFDEDVYIFLIYNDEGGLYIINDALSRVMDMAAEPIRWTDGDMPMTLQ
jgi:hypothetical protein